MQCMSGICEEKALVQHLCERFDCSHTIYLFILTDSITLQTQILLSRDFDGCMPDIFFIQMNFLW